MNNKTCKYCKYYRDYNEKVYKCVLVNQTYSLNDISTCTEYIQKYTCLDCIKEERCISSPSFQLKKITCNSFTLKLYVENDKKHCSDCEIKEKEITHLQNIIKHKDELLQYKTDKIDYLINKLTNIKDFVNKEGI
jgi:hypothetical protein